MRSEMLQDAFGYIDDELILSAVHSGGAKRVAKNVIRRVAAAAAVIALVFCGVKLIFFTRYSRVIVRTDLCDIVTIGDQYFLSPNIALNNVSSSPGIDFMLPGLDSASKRYVFFHSVEKMDNALRTGSFTKAQLIDISRSIERINGGYPIPNPNTLKDIIMPEGVDLKGVRILGENYQFEFLGTYRDGQAEGVLTLQNTNNYQAYLEAYSLESICAEESFQLLSQQTDPLTGGTVTEFEYTPFRNKVPHHRKFIVYTLTQGGKTVTVQEEYDLAKSEATAVRIRFWGKDGEQHFTGVIEKMTQRPEPEWMATFGLKPYRPGESEYGYVFPDST